MACNGLYHVSFLPLERPDGQLEDIQFQWPNLLHPQNLLVFRYQSSIYFKGYFAVQNYAYMTNEPVCLPLFSVTVKVTHLKSALFNIIWLSGTCLKWSMCYRQRFICRPNHKSHPVLRQERQQARDAPGLVRADTRGISFVHCLVRTLRRGQCFPPSPWSFFPNPPSYPCPQLWSIWKINSLSSVFPLDFAHISIRALITPYFLQTFIKHLTIARHCTGPGG